MDLALAERENTILGQDFLTWLWHATEARNGIFKDREGREFHLRMEERLSVQGGDGEGLESASVKSPSGELTEARSGLRTGQVSRALSDDERSAAALAQEQARLQAEAEAMQKRRDLAMVESYATEADLRRAYGERTELLDETLKASTLGVTNLRLSLLNLLRQASDRELSGDIVSKSLTTTIRDQHVELLRQQQILASQRLDRAALDDDLKDALLRYRALKAPPGAAATAKPDAQAGPAPAAG